MAQIPDYLQLYDQTKQLAQLAQANLPPGHPTRIKVQTLFGLMDPGFLRELTQRRLTQLSNPFKEYPLGSLSQMVSQEKNLIENLKSKFPGLAGAVPISLDKLIAKISDQLGGELKKAMKGGGNV